MIGDERQIFPGHERGSSSQRRRRRRRRPGCQEIYLRQRYHVFGCSRPATNNSLIYLYSSFKARLKLPPMRAYFLRPIFAGAPRACRWLQSFLPVYTYREELRDPELEMLSNSFLDVPVDKYSF